MDFKASLAHMPRYLPFLLFSLFLFLLLIQPLSDTDFGWHYRCGNNILSGQPSCVTNTFSYYLADYQWYYSSFGYDLILAVAHNTGGFLAVGIAGAVIITAIFLIIYHELKINVIIKMVLIGIALFLLWHHVYYGFRAQYMSLLGYILILAISYRNLVSFHKSFWLTPVIMLIWTNSHMGFFLGLATLYLLVGIVLINFYRGLNAYTQKMVFKLGAIVLLSTLVTLINPYSWKIYIGLYHHVSVPLSTIIAEWTSPTTLYISIMVFFTAAYLINQFFFAKQKNIFEIIMILALTYLGVTARRNIPVYSIGTCFIWGKSIELIPLSFLEKYFSKSYVTYWLSLALVMLILFISIPLAYKSITEIQTGSFLCKTRVRLPCDAVAFLHSDEAPDLTGKNIYNTYEWGGYLVWQLPQAQFFVDGRMPAWTNDEGESAYTTFLHIIQAKEGWDKTLESLNTDYLIISAHTFLGLELTENAADYKYNEIYNNGKHVIYEKY